MDYYDEYFDTQTGGGARTGYGGISHVYVGSPNQRGHGIGSFLGGLFRRIIPLLKQGARTVGREALRTGINVANDVLDTGAHPREAFKTRLRESGENLKRKAEEKISSLMKGSGYKEDAMSRLMHSSGGRASRRVRVKKRKIVVPSRKRSGRVNKKKKKTTKKKKTRTTKQNTVKGRKKKKTKARTVSDIFA